MQPKSRELIEGIIEVLDDRVTPAVEDRWAASSLRSIRCLLVHLATRVDNEGQVLHDDIADARAVLELAVVRLERSEVASDLAAEIRQGLAKVWREPGAYVAVASLAEENLVLRNFIDHLLRQLLTQPAATYGGGDDGLVELLAEVRAYIRRQITREQPMFMPAFAGPLF